MTLALMWARNGNDWKGRFWRAETHGSVFEGEMVEDGGLRKGLEIKPQSREQNEKWTTTDNNAKEHGDGTTSEGGC